MSSRLSLATQLVQGQPKPSPLEDSGGKPCIGQVPLHLAWCQPPAATSGLLPPLVGVGGPAAAGLEPHTTPSSCSCCLPSLPRTPKSTAQKRRLCGPSDSLMGASVPSSVKWKLPSSSSSPTSTGTTKGLQVTRCEVKTANEGQ